MKHFPARAVVLIALAVPLGACSSFLGINFARHAPRPMPEAAPAGALTVKAGGDTELGRRHLADGQTGLAIESFQRALAGGEAIAPAVNGLGIAYARLDRFDLAQRYFQQAIASDPVNSKYADNLARLMRSSALAMRRDGDIARAALLAVAVTEAKAQAANPGPVVGKILRVSRGEVRIATAPPQAAPSAATGRAAIDSRFLPSVRFSIAESTAPRPHSSIRFMLPEPTAAEAGAPKVGEAGVRR